jgi:hypothetical protein
LLLCTTPSGAAARARSRVLAMLSSRLSRSVRRLCTSFYDSQSGRTVTVPEGVQCHVDLSAVAANRVPSALKHLLRDGQPVSGLASVMRAVATDEQSVEAVQGGEVCVVVSERQQGVAALAAARRLEMRAWAVLQPGLCSDPYDLQLNAAEIGDAGAEAILLSVDSGLEAEDLREMIDMACEIDLLGVPMRSRLGLRVAPGAGALKLVQFAHDELGLLHHMACLAGMRSPRPSEVLKAAGVGPADANFGPIFLAEHVPDAA